MKNTRTAIQLVLAFTSGLFSAWVFLDSYKKRTESRQQKQTKQSSKQLPPNGLNAKIRNKSGFNRQESQKYCSTVSPDEVMDLIVSRRSYYPDAYTGSTVPDEDVRKILEAANWGISHANSQPWRFVVFADVDVLLDKTSKYFKNKEKSIFPWKGYTGYDEFLEGFEQSCLSRWSKCSHVVGVGMKRKSLSKRTNPIWEEICAVATGIQNACLMATSLKVACYWSSWYEPFTSSSECIDFFGLNSEDGDLCLGVLCVGFSNKFGKAKAKREGFDAKVTWVSADRNTEKTKSSQQVQMCG